MASFLTEELSHRINRLRDDQARTNAGFELRIKELEAENKDIRNRLAVLTRLLISRQLATAEEIASALAAASAVPASTAPVLTTSTSTTEDSAALTETPAAASADSIEPR